MTNSSFSSCSKPLRAARSGKPPLTVPPHPTCSPTGLGNPLGQPTVVLCSQPRDRPSWPTAGAQEMFWLNEWLLPERLLVLLWVPGTRQRVEYPCLVGTSASVSPNNQCQGRKGPRAHLVHLTDAQRGYALAPDHTASWWQSWDPGSTLTLPWKHLQWGANGPPIHLFLPSVLCSRHFPHPPSTASKPHQNTSHCSRVQRALARSGETGLWPYLSQAM